MWGPFESEKGREVVTGRISDQYLTLEFYLKIEQNKQTLPCVCMRRWVCAHESREGVRFLQVGSFESMYVLKSSARTVCALNC